MSIRVMTQVWDCDRYEGGALLVLLAMADWAADDGARVFPTVAKLAKKARLTERGVQKCLKKLKDDGVITLVAKASGKQRRANEWRINIDHLNDVHPTIDDVETVDTTDAEGESPLGDTSLIVENAATSDGVDVGRTEFTPQIANQESAEEFTPPTDTPDGCTAVASSGERPAATGEQPNLTGELCNIAYIDEPSFQPPSQPLSHPPSARAHEVGMLDSGGSVVELPGKMPTFLRRFEDEDFNRFLRAFPSTGQGPDETLKVWKATAKIRPSIEALLAAVENYVARMASENLVRPADNQRQPCHASKWLREKRWLVYAPLPPRPKIEGDAVQRDRARRAAWGGSPAVKKICDELGEPTFDQWFAPCRLTTNEGVPILHAPSRLVRDMLANKHMDRLEAAFGRPVILELNEAKLAVAAA